MRFAVGFAIMVAMVGVFAIAVGSHVADEIDRLWGGVTSNLEGVFRNANR